MTNKTKKLISLTFLLCLSHYSIAEYQAIDKVVAIVDNDVISQSDLDEKIQQVLKGLNQNQDIPEKELKKQVLDRLIIESLQMQLAQRAGVSISEERLTQALLNIAERNNLSLENFRIKLEADGISYNTMREQIRREMVMQQVQQGHLRNRIQITEQEIDNYLDSVEGKKYTSTRYKMSHIVLPLSSDDSSEKAAIAKNDLLQIRQNILDKKYRFDALIKGKTISGHKLSGSSFDWSEKQDLPSLFAESVSKLKKGDISEPVRSGAGWHLLKLDDIQGDAEIVHQIHSRHILVKPSEVRNEQQTEELINSLRQRIIDGEDFSLIAKEYSEDPGSALQGGDLGWSNPGQFVPEFDATLNNLKDGELSAPFKTAFGYHIIQKIAERDHDLTRERQRGQAEQAIYERKFGEELEAWLVKIREEAFIEIK